MVVEVHAFLSSARARALGRLVLLAGVALSPVGRADEITFHAGWAVGAPQGGAGTILRSEDSGNTWSRQGLGQVASVEFSGVSAASPVAAWVVGDASEGYATIYHTSNGGVTWTRQGSAGVIPNTGLTKVHALNTSNVWAVGTSAILHSTDGGQTWLNHVPAGYENTHLQGIFAVDATHVWVTGATNAAGYATILKSSDAGATWLLQTGGEVNRANHLLGISAVDAQTAWTVGGTGSGYIALRTTDGGATWSEQDGLIGSYDANEVSAVNATTVWVACDRMLYRSTDGGANWAGQGAGDYTVGLSAVSPLEAWATRALYNGSLYHTTDGGTNWTQITQLGGENLPGMTAVSFALQAIPEPSTLALCLGCLGFAALWSRRRRHQ